MARLLTTGFELDQVGAESSLMSAPIGTPTFDTSVKRSGSRSLLCSAGASQECMQLDVNGATQGRDYFMRCAVRWNAAPSTQGGIMSMGIFGQLPWRLVLKTDNKLELWNMNDTVIGGASFQGAAATWYVIEVQFNVPSSGSNNAHYRWWVDGVEIANTTVGPWAAFPTAIYLGHHLINLGTNLRFDDFALNDDQGSTSQTGRCGYKNKVAMIYPVSDSLRNQWTGGAGGTTNLWDAVNNPTVDGVAVASATNASQIVDSNNASLTHDYEAQLAAYTDSVASGGAGMDSADKVVVYRALGRGGNNTTTSRTLHVRALSNPNIITASTGGSGATAAATDPTGWTTLAVQTIDPTPTLGTGPVIRVRKTDAFNTLTYDFIGAVVEYAPTQKIDITPVTETDAAQTLDIDKQLTLTPATETDAAQTLDVDKKLTLTPVTEADAVVALDVDKQLTLTPLAESDAAQTLDIDKQLTLTPVAESDAVVALDIDKQLTLTPITETDAVQSLSLVKYLTLTSLDEADAVVALALEKQLTLTALTETDEVQTPHFANRIEPLLETDTVVPVHLAHGFFITPLTELDEVGAATAQKFLSLVPLDEVDEVAALVLQKEFNLVPVEEADVVGILTIEKRLALVPLDETDEVQVPVVVLVKNIYLTPLLEIDTVGLLSITHAIGSYGGNDELEYSYGGIPDGAIYGEAVGTVTRSGSYGD